MTAAQGFRRSSIFLSGISFQETILCWEVRNYLATRPEGRFIFVFTPTHDSWLNLIEGFFSKMTKQMLKGIRVNSKEELEERIYKYFDEVNQEPVVYHWTYKLDEISAEEANAY